MFDLGNVTQGGVNAWDWVKALDKIVVENISTTKDIFDGNLQNVAYDEIENQNLAIQFSKQGLPNATLYDPWNDEKVDDDIWKNRYEIKLEEERKWREEYAKRMEEEKRNNPKKYNSNFKNESDIKAIKLSKEEEIAKCEEEAIKSYEKTSINIRGKWEYTADLIGRDKRQYIEFKDGTSGNIYQYEAEGKNDNYKYALSPGIGYKEYNSESETLKALYIYKKCGFFTEIGKKK